MEMIRTVIVDDEALACDTLRIRLRRDPDVALVAVCRDPHDAITAIRTHAPDLVFLDVQMPGIDGFDVLDAIDGSQAPVVVFVTAWDTYALRAFERHALDYLLKPFDEERFQQALERAKRRITERRDGALARSIRALLGERAGLRDEPPASPGNEPPRSQPADHRRIMVRDRGRFVFLSMRDIEFVRAAGNYLALCAGKRRHYLRATMNDLLDRLDPERFIRVHRSTIVNLDFVRELTARDNGTYTVTMTDGTDLVLSRTFRDSVLQRVI